MTQIRTSGWIFLFTFGIICLAATAGKGDIIWPADDDPNETLDTLAETLDAILAGTLDAQMTDAIGDLSEDLPFLGADGSEAHPTGSAATFGMDDTFASVPEYHLRKRKKRTANGLGGGGGSGRSGVASGRGRGGTGNTFGSVSGSGGVAAGSSGPIGIGPLESQGGFQGSGLISGGTLGADVGLGGSIPGNSFLGSGILGSDAIGFSSDKFAPDTASPPRFDGFPGSGFLGGSILGSDTSEPSQDNEAIGSANINGSVTPEPGSLLIWGGLGVGAILLSRRKQLMARI